MHRQGGVVPAGIQPPGVYKRTAALLIAASAIVISAAALAAGTDELWETSVQMQGMALPPQRVCVAKGQRDPAKMAEQRGSQCKTTSMSKSGNKVTWKVKCPDGDGSGEIAYSGNDRYDGKMRMTQKGETMEMTMSGKRVGTCDIKEQQTAVEDMRNMMAGQQRMAQEQMQQARAQQDEQCRKAVEDYNWKAVFPESSCRYIQNAKERQQCIATYANPQMPGCKTQQPAMCGRISPLAADMKSYDGYARVASGHTPLKGEWKDAFAACKVAVPAQPSCAKAVSDKAWRFVAGFCPAETEAVAKAQCPAARAYTAIDRSKGDIGYVCVAYWNKREGVQGDIVEASDGSAPAAQPAASRSPAPAPEQPSATGEVMKEGAKALRRLLPF